MGEEHFQGSLKKTKISDRRQLKTKFMLEVNFNCSVAFTKGQEADCDVLKWYPYCRTSYTLLQISLITAGKTVNIYDVSDMYFALPQV